MRKKQIGFVLLVAGLLAAIAFITWPRAALAQCGSSASSCKNCHEVKKQDPVNTQGAWHTAHAFGDFCEFCHAGNVKATDKASAHAGMIDPLADVKGSCQSCHPSDYMARAKTYADALGKTIATGGAPAGGSPSATNAMTTTAAASAPCGPAAPAGGQTIDLNKAYSGLNQPPPNILGNVVLIALIAAVLLLLGVLVWHYERPFERIVLAARVWMATPVLVAATAEGAALNLPRQLVARPEVQSLLPLLAGTDPATLRAVEQLLSDRDKGPRLLKALSRADWQTLSSLSDRDQRVLATLLAIAKEMKSSR